MSDQTREAQAKTLESVLFEEWQPSDCPLLDWHQALTAGASALRAQSALVAALEAMTAMVVECGYGGANASQEKADIKRARAALAMVEKQP